MIAVIAGLLVGGGAAAAVVLLGEDDTAPTQASGLGETATVPADDDAPIETGQGDPPNEPGQEGSASEATGLPTDDRAQIGQEIQDLLLAFHEDVVAERFRDAWSLLSARKRSQTLREDGYAKWARAQASLSPYLSPAGLTVRVDELEDEGVARVLVTGMDWSAPGASCAQWSGLTWARYEAGAWAYDPGYSTTPERERAWKPRFDELLGASC